MGKTSKNFYLVLIFLHLIITVPLAYVLNVWVDEASTLYNTNKGLLDALQNVFHNEKQAPLYFWILSLWRTIDGSIFFARLFSIICSLLAIKIFYDLAQKFFTGKKAIFAAAFFALHPYLIWASLEVRLYSMLILLSILLLKFFDEGYLKQTDTKEQRSSRIFFIILAVVGIYTNYYIGFWLVGGFAALLILRRWEAAKIYFLQMFIIGLAILPLAWVIKTQLEVNTGGHEQGSEAIQGLKILWGHLLNFVFPTELMPMTDEQSFISFLRIWLVRFGILALILLLIKNKFRILQNEKVQLFGTISAIIIAFLFLAYLMLGSEYLSIRHAAIFFVPLILLVIYIFDDLLPEKSWIVLAIISALLFPYSLYNLYPTFAKRGDWLNISRYIEANEKPDQPIITSQVYDAISLPFHYKGKNRLFPDEGFFEWDLENSLKSENGFVKQNEFIISKIPADAREIWVLSRDTCHNEETKIACQPLENYLQEHYTIEIEKDFYLQKVRLLRKKQ